jgi:DNA-binding NarL/FixJ family response regulator
MRILLADDQSRVRSALQMILKEEPGMRVVGEVAEAKGLLVQLQVTQPDLVLLDWELPGLAAIGSLPALRMLCPQVAVIALSGRPEVYQEALSAGVDAFVSKMDPPERLLATLRAINKKGS